MVGQWWCAQATAGRVAVLRWGEGVWRLQEWSEDRKRDPKSQDEPP